MNLHITTSPKPLVFSPPILHVATEIPLAQQQPALFAAALIHEVRNPLTNINLAVEMLQSLTIGEEERSYLDIILRSSNRINVLITDLVIQQHSNVDKVEEYSLHHLLDEVLIIAADRIMLKNITVVKEYSTSDYREKMDIEKMKIALTNIVINAVDAMQNENGHLRLITTSVNGKFILKIEDNGCGICARHIENIFKPYFTLKTGGLGIGLAATFEILKANKVIIAVESELGKGTTFALSFAKNCLVVNKSLKKQKSLHKN